MKLFAFYIGGDTRNSNIELHDFRIIAAESFEACLPRLKQDWWGLPETLHLDCWGELQHADGYDITLSPEPFTGEDKLWFVNLGGYLKTDFTEQHKNVFIVAKREVQARAKALKEVLDWDGHHKDTQFEVEKVLDLTTMVPAGLHLHLIPNASGAPFTFACGYRPIGKPDFVMKW